MKRKLIYTDTLYPNKKLKISHNEFENDQLSEFDKIVLNKGKSPSIDTAPLEFCDEGSSTFIRIKSNIESSSTSAPITSVAEDTNISADVSSIVVDNKNNSTTITSVIGGNNNPTLVTEVIEGNSTSSINSVAVDSSDTVLRSMHGVVNLFDNNLPARFNYPKPIDYQDLISQYCDIWSKGLCSESEITVQLLDLRQRILGFIDFCEDRVFDEDIPIIEYYREQLITGDEFMRDAGLDSVVDDLNVTTPASDVTPDNTPFVDLEGTLSDLYTNWDSSCVWDFLDYLQYLT